MINDTTKMQLQAASLNFTIRRYRFNPWIGKFPWRRAWQLTLLFLLGKSHGLRQLQRVGQDWSDWAYTKVTHLTWDVMSSGDWDTQTRLFHSKKASVAYPSSLHHRDRQHNRLPLILCPLPGKWHPWRLGLLLLWPASPSWNYFSPSRAVNFFQVLSTQLSQHFSCLPACWIFEAFTGIPATTISPISYTIPQPNILSPYIHTPAVFSTTSQNVLTSKYNSSFSASNLKEPPASQ